MADKKVDQIEQKLTYSSQRKSNNSFQPTQDYRDPKTFSLALYLNLSKQ